VQKTAPVAAEPVLYARDGSIVSPQGVSSNSGLPRRDVQNADGSRAKILELYQRVVEERDKLTLELASNAAELAHVQAALTAETARANQFEARLGTLEQSTSELGAQNLELAARLTAAQIRGLEAEKRWLELSLSLPANAVAANAKPAAVQQVSPAVEKRAVEQH
jgi:chromosome segregation ATPase